MEDKSIDKQLNNTRETNPNSLANLKKATPWKPGESGNPTGRPKNIKYISEAMREILESDPELLVGVVKELINKAKKGDVPAFKEFAERLDGRVPYAVEHGLQNSEALEELLSRLRGKKDA